VQKALWGLKWNALNNLQQQAIPKILQSDGHLILSAATASGKTEAAFLPILSAIVADEAYGLSVLYVGPLKALINDQFQRLETLCEHLDIPVHRWHGDISADAKRKFIDHPRGVLLITPESIESLFVNRSEHLPRLFGSLRFVVVDELHAFLDNARGRHLRSLLDRVARLGSFRIIGLSATIGDTAVAQDWIDRHNPLSVEVVEGENPESELLCRLSAYRIDPHHVHDAEGDDESQPEVLRMAEDIVKRHSGKSNLIFCNAKAQVEELADRVARIAEWMRLPDQILVHHGALSADSRVEVEEIMKSGAVATAFCSSTLEMGIDIGHVEAVGQVGPPFSVAGLKQRAGRSGRKPGTPRILRIYVECEQTDANTSVIDRMHVNLVQSIAMVELIRAKFVESPRPAICDLSTLTQQVISVIAETGGLPAVELYDRLCVRGAFPAIESRLFVELLRSLKAHDIIEQAGDGSIILGLMGEAIRKDKGFYAVFPTPDEFAVLHDGRAIGKIGFMPSEHQVNSRFLLARKRWQIIDLDLDGKLVFVKPSRTRKPAVFATSNSADLDAAIVEKMRQTLLHDDMPEYIDATARTVLASARTAARSAGLLARGLVSLSDRSTAVMLWSGTRVNNTIIAWLRMNGIAVESWGVGLVAATGHEPVRILLQRFVEESPKAAAIVADFPAPTARKYDRFLSDSLRHETYIRDSIDITGGQTVLRDFLPAKTTPVLTNVPMPAALSASSDTSVPLIAVIDVETTGLLPQRHNRVLEIAAVVMTPDGTVVREFESLVNPDRDVGPTHVHGLTASDVAAAPRFRDVMAAMLPVLHGTVAIAGHNVRFDITFLNAELERIGVVLPELTSLCTLRMAGGGKLADCCRDFGIAFEGFEHHALHDARASGKLLSILLREDPRLRHTLETTPTIQWPKLSPSFLSHCTRRGRRALLDTPTTYLARLAVERTRIDAPPEDAAKVAYLNLLDRTLEDRRLDDMEMDSLVSMAVNLGMARDDVLTCHREYLSQLARIAVENGIVTDAEKADLARVSSLLGLAETELENVLTFARQSPTIASKEQTGDFRGLQVCFTGEIRSRYQGRLMTREVAESLAAAAGMIIANSVTKKLDMLVVADADTASGKAKKARQYGIRILQDSVFWRTIGVNID
jgi:ATP-dependent Lhr-like helicase